jgi:hypothetical protein
MQIDQLDPPAAESLEGGCLRGIYDVLDNASDHTST